MPDVFVVSEDVEKGKPEYVLSTAARTPDVGCSRFPLSALRRPDPYLLGAKRAGVDPARCLVVEDAPAGIRSGRAAGSKTLGLITSHTREQMEEVKPDYLVRNLSK